MTPRPRTIEQETEGVRAVQDKGAARYDRQISFFERVLFADGRQWACSQAQGKVLELALGTGRNLEHYPAEVEITGVELSERMLAIARERAGSLGRSVDLRQGDAQALELPDESFDTAV